MIQIEKGIPAPEPKGESFKQAAWATFRSMQPGDSILVPAEDARAWRSHASNYAKEGRRRGHSCAFVTRSVEGGVRIWRTE